MKSDSPGKTQRSPGAPAAAPEPAAPVRPGQSALARFSQEHDVRLHARETIYQGFARMERLTISHRLFDGSWSPQFSRELFARGDAVAVLPYDPRHDEVVLNEQFRVGAIDGEAHPWLIEMVAGICEPGESPTDVAHREAEEEAGLALTRLIPITRYLVSPGGTNETIHLFCGLVDVSKAGGVFGLATENEDIQTYRLGRADAFRWVEDGTICNAATIIAMQWLQLHHQQLIDDAT